MQTSGTMQYAAKAEARYLEIKGELAAKHPERNARVLISGKTGDYIVYTAEANDLFSADDARRIAEFMADKDMDDDTMLVRALAATKH